MFIKNRKMNLLHNSKFHPLSRTQSSDVAYFKDNGGSLAIFLCLIYVMIIYFFVYKTTHICVLCLFFHLY